ncbi:putative methyltransferase PMT3 [Senna tora]|uniref:Methyltransferase n=1 Tax=Senna tora TaxID=362788 RepID=A0A834X4G2_9FABA|nr:putative methyltransferase PMT3 [Senna tora]
MSRGRSDGSQKKHLVASIFVVAIFLGFLYVYYGSRNSGTSALEYGSKSLKRLGSSYLGTDDDANGKQDDSSSSFGQGDLDDDIVPKSFPVCDDRHSELIPCLDRHLIYQMRLKLDLSLMEHYERHCPPSERRYNCLIPPPGGYKVPIKWPQSRDEVWKANIPHTHLAHEKSDQNWMVVKGEKIVFPGGGTHFHYGADKYIASIANVNDNRVQGSGLAPWPARLTSPPPRLADFGYTNEMCEAYSTYPRTYDLLHAWTVFSDLERRECSPEDLLIEMDRMLRPTGFIIIHDKQHVIEFVKKYLPALHWEAVATSYPSSESDQDGDEVVFIIQKKLWLTSESFRDTE